MRSTLPFMPADNEHLDVSALETWLWDAACAIRGATDAPKFKDFIPHDAAWLAFNKKQTLTG